MLCMLLTALAVLPKHQFFFLLELVFARDVVLILASLTYQSNQDALSFLGHILNYTPKLIPFSREIGLVYDLRFIIYELLLISNFFNHKSSIPR